MVWAIRSLSKLVRSIVTHRVTCNDSLLTTMLSGVVLAFLPFVSAAIHRLPLQRLPRTIHNPDVESLYLAEKYGAPQQQSLNAPHISRPTTLNGEQLFWTQEDVKEGHRVPLTSLSSCTNPVKYSLFILDFMNAQYYTEISLGTPAQSVSIFSYSAADILSPL